MRRVITRLKGGLGNQLFCYAAARRLSLANDAELVLDTVSGFARDYQFQRHYSLDRFAITARPARPWERFAPLERPRRALEKLLARSQPFEQRRYLIETGMEFDTRLLNVKIRDWVYLDGYWQSEGYFADIEPTLRKDLDIQPPSDRANLDAATMIAASNAVCLHVRWFEEPTESEIGSPALAAAYYQRAMHAIEARVGTVHYFLFSDDPIAAVQRLGLPTDRATPILHNRGAENAIYDLWLMSQCKHFIIANSTFSWWAAWLGCAASKVVVAPAIKTSGVAAWGFEGLLPSTWLTL